MLVPKGTNVKKMPDGSTDQLIAYIKALYDLSVTYGGMAGNSPAMVDTNRRVMEWLRHPTYDTIPWSNLVSEPDEKFIDYVDSHRKDVNLSPVPSFEAPSSPGPVRPRTVHWGASLNGVFVRGMPPSAANGGVSLIGRGDVAGWGGDWITFYGEWERDFSDQQDGYAYCQAHLFRDGTTFKMQDLIEDVDAFNIAMRMRAQPTLSVADAVAQYYGGTATPTKTRYKDFYTVRYGAPPATIGGPVGALDSAAVTAINMLKDLSDPIIVSGRKYLIWKTKAGGDVRAVVNTIDRGVYWNIIEAVSGPNNDELIQFCKGYKDMLLGLVLKEAAGQPAQP